MKSKLLIIIIMIVCLGILVGYLILKKDNQNLDTNISNNVVNEKIEIENSLSKIEENVSEDFEWEQEILMSLRCQKNTYYSVKEKYEDCIYEVFQKYGSEYALIGDTTILTIAESNYNQYEHDISNIKLEKYDENINIKLARILEGTYSLIEKESNSLAEIVKVQSEKGIQSDGELVGKDGYFEITGMMVMNGNNTSKEEWKNSSRAKKISVIINSEKEYGFELEDTMEVQLIDLNYRQDGVDTPIDVEIKVLEVYEGEKSNDVYISDIRFGVDSSISGGI